MAIRKYYRGDIIPLSSMNISSSKNTPKETPEKETKKKRPKWQRILFYSAISCLVLFFGVFAYFAKQLPNPKDFQERVVKQSTRIYDKTGEILLYEAGGDIKRTYVKLEDISSDLQHATIAAEDANFYKHFGIDAKGFARIFYYAIFKRGQKIPGGSTITQQFIKNALLSPERSIARKIKEAILALELERRYSKDQILEFYLNQIPYGSIYYGAETASQHYFQKKAKDLTLAEAAALAALPQSPTYYLKNDDDREVRKNWILDRMVKLGYISEKEAEEAKKEKIAFEAIPEKMLAPYFVEEVKKQLSEMYGKEDYQLMGLKVYTTLNYNLQKLAEKTVNEFGPKTEKNFGAKNMALVSINPKNGEVLAMVGGRNFDKSQVNIWTPTQASSFQSPGSAFKPIVYANAFKRGYTPDTIVWDVKTDFGNYSPDNYDMKQRGPIKLKEALAQSLNIPAVKTLYLGGIQETANTAKSMGMIKSFDPKIDTQKLNLGMAIGGKSIVPIELVSAFGVFATEGQRHLPVYISKIEDRNGKVIYEADYSGQKVLDAEIARSINSILSDNSLRAPMFGSHSYLNLGPWAAVKTGTAATQKGEVTDVWTIGYTKNIVTGVWIGNNHNEPLRRGSDGSNVAGPVWNSFMKQATKNEPKTAFPAYKKIKTGKPILDGILPGKHCILYWVIKENPRGPYPKNPALDPQYIKWESAINGFAVIPEEPTPTTQETTPTPTPTLTPTPTPTLTPTPTPTLTPTPTPTLIPTP